MIIVENRKSRIEKSNVVVRFWAILFISLISILDPLSAAFIDAYGSARVAALSGAFTAVSNDASGVFYNAAALSRLSRREAFFSYASLFSGMEEVLLSLSHLETVQPLGSWGTVGAGWRSFNSPNLYREDTALVCYGVGMERVSAGVTVRYMTRKFQLDSRAMGDPVFRGGGRTDAVAVDLHLHGTPDLSVLNGITFGFSARSLNQPDVGYQNIERLPIELAGGLLYRVNRFSIPIDVTERSGLITPHFGLEAALADKKVFLRAGSDLDQVSSGAGYHRRFNHWSLALDYAFLWPLKFEGSEGSHRGTFGIRF